MVEKEKLILLGMLFRLMFLSRLQLSFPVEAITDFLPLLFFFFFLSLDISGYATIYLISFSLFLVQI